MEFTLLAAAIIAVGAMMLALRFLRLPLAPGPNVQAVDVQAVDAQAVSESLYLAVGAGILGGRLWSIVAGGTNPLTHLGDVLIIRGGVATGAASLVALAAWAFSVRKNARMLSDLAAPAMLVGLAGWHLGCVVRDSCAGTATDLPWAITLPGSVVGRHPVELYAAALMLGAAYLLHRRPIGSGTVFGLALAAAAATRWATEPFRASLSGGPIVWYIAGTLAGMAVWLAATRLSQDPPP